MKRNPPTCRQGNIAILSCALLAIMMGMVAFAVDLGYIAHARTELQRTADAVALAAAAQLPNQGQAVSTGIATAQSNSSPISPTLDGNDFVFGFWNRNTSTFTSPAPVNRQANAVKVTIARTQAEGNPLNLFYGNVLGKSTTDVNVTSIAFMDRGLCGAFIGIDWLSVPGTPNTDSFDSVDGSYDPATAGHRGSICSDGDITIEGTAEIWGDARAGVGADVILEGGVVVTGNIGNRIKPLNMPLVDASPYQLVNDNLTLPLIKKGGGWISPYNALTGDFTLDGTKVYSIPPGVYYFRNVSLSGQAVLNITGNTTIFITGDLYRGGGVQVNNNTQLASNLEIYMTGGTAEITSENAFYGVLYAPNTDVRIAGSADYFGAIVGKTLIATGTGMAHYDECLDLEYVDPPTRTTLVD